MEWQPIKTAPKDGTWIIGRDGPVTYPCAYNIDEELWYAPADFTFVKGVLPSEWMPIPVCET